jgi:hypothetical protein
MQNNQAIGAVCWSPWIPHTYHPDTIIGHWAEDNTSYLITCPPQLREQIITMQNALCKLYEQSQEYHRKGQEVFRMLNSLGLAV